MSRAVVVIDVQNEYFAGGALPLHQASEVEARLVEALAKARTAGDRIVLVRHVSRKETGLFVAGGEGAVIRSSVKAVAADAPVTTKRFADAFQETDLADHLQDVSELLICGMMTQNCVVFTAMSRAADGLAVKVIADLCAAPTEIVHQIALNALSSKMPVVNAADIWS
jgi:nicotinamidase-related amidase